MEKQRSKPKPEPKQANLKNYRARTDNAFDDIQHILVSHGAKSLTFDYDQGRAAGVTFVIVVRGERLSFHMPARVQNVEHLLSKQQHWRQPITEIHKQQAYRTAWANIRDWLAAQMALVETEMVQMEEIFLPYLLTPTGESLFFAMQERQFLLPAPEKK